MATAIVPYQPERNTDPSLTNNDVLWKTGALKEPLVHYSQESRILSEVIYNNAGVNGALVSPSIFGGRTIFSGATSGNWQLPTAAALLQELRSIYGDFAQKLNNQSFEAKADFINSSPNPINLTTNTGLTLTPSPIILNSLSNIVLIFEVVGSTHDTAAILVRVEGSGGAANAPPSITITTDPALTVTQVGNNFNIGINGPVNNVASSNLEIAWNPTLQTFQTRGIISQQWFDLNFLASPGQLMTATYAALVWPVAFSVPAAVATYNNTTGVLTIVKPGPWVICAHLATVALKPAPTGQTVLATGVPAGERVSATLLYNGVGFIEIAVGDEGCNGDAFVFNFGVGDTLQWVAAQTGGTFASIVSGSAWTGGPLY